MKTKNAKLIVVIFVMFLALPPVSTAQIAAGYNGDIGIVGDPNIIFVEMFEGATPSTLTASGNWNQMTSVAGNIVFDPSVPSGSPGSRSLKLATVDDGTLPNENTFLYKKITPDITDSVFVRYYVKYDTTTRFHHSGVYVGGKNPPSATAGLIGGVLPLGNVEFHVGTEIRGMTPSANGLFGFYNYWMGMNPHTTGPYAGYYYGNEFLNSTVNDIIDMSSWNCIELMVKLNTPVTAKNGEIALWVNGVKISHYGYNFPNGTWNETQFTEGSGAPFEGFQWRNDAALNINYVWLKNFSDNNAVGHVGSVYFDHLVVARKYIGPMGSAVGIRDNNRETEVSVFPNPAFDRIHIKTGTQELSKVVVYNLSGQTEIESDKNDLSISALAGGLYFVAVQTNSHKYVRMLIKKW
jgi:hypothetical protein